jgi:hypothetical protein
VVRIFCRRSLGLGQRIRALAALTAGVEGRVGLEIAVIEDVAQYGRERGLD